MTWFTYHNYGTALQVTALYKTLKNLGCMPDVINYAPQAKSPMLHNSNMLVEEIAKFRDRLKNHSYHRYDIPNREEKFQQFQEKYLTFSKACKGLIDLEALNDKYQGFICGSDQIWAPSVFDPHYFLDFVLDDNKKISYAPSVGLNRIEDDIIKDKIAYYSSKIKYLSTREKSGSEIISELTGREVETVIDPTLLVTESEWADIANDYADNLGEYMLVYVLGNNESVWKSINAISKKMNLPIRIIPVFYKDLKRTGCIEDSIGPEEFLSLVKNASFVCTDSFHGLAFSIIFKKNFSVFERFKEGNPLNQNSRIYNILKILNLTDRIMKGNEIEPTQYVDYEDVYGRLEEQKEKSLQFLKNAISQLSEYSSNRKNNVLNKTSVCCGCGVCASVCHKNAIRINLNDEGFYQSFVDESLCVGCGKCVKVCPEINQPHNAPLKSAELYSYIDNDADVLKKSSSGGFAYAMSKNAHRAGWAVVGCVFDKKKHEPEHIIVTPSMPEEKLHDLQGSKYLQSYFAGAISQIANQKTVIIGTPCQIAGARNLLPNKDIVFVDLICHGVPSRQAYIKYLEYLNKYKGLDTGGDFSTVFRYKECGWREIYIYNENCEKSYCESQYKDPFFLIFEHGFCYSKNCYECPWRSKSAADIRLGDYWHEKYSSNNQGVSMVAVFTDKGKEFLKNVGMENSGKLLKEPMSDYFACQQIENNTMPVFREFLLTELYSNKSLEEVVNLYIMPFERRRRIRNLLKQFKLR